ncbi:hypothetical protein [Pelagibaculum spongiae]|uniref:Uncharacterized protein n=1 Tax=Pelagibaculum spongiae TaxID=2080658 RepID=A0A2V1H289_9GAMM|nr:hypothetical protein [Pelagibaculum spongiae]PVZ72080.1 hypothetical protein DC094_03415 [Pelagibaculum spongiae]
MRLFKGLLAIAAIAFFVHQIINPSAIIEHADGILVPGKPLQTATSAKPFSYGSHKINPLADLSVTALVVAKKDDYQDQMASLLPVDLGLTWGELSDSKLLNNFSFVQKDRKMFIRYPKKLSKLRINFTELYANMHVVPANEQVAKILKKITVGDIIEMEGQLIEVDTLFWSAASSLSRTDKGDMACEILWIKRLEIITEKNNFL